jgi:endoglucanase
MCCRPCLLLLLLGVAACEVHTAEQEVRAAEQDQVGWPEWEAFVARFMQEDGRIVDLTFDGKTTSEGQSYALFFALVANQRERFDALLQWTSENLAGGRLGERLPAWLWGRREDGSWGVKDENAAADADLWIAYSLLEAARLWNAPEYEVTGRKVLALIREKDVADAGRAGTVLLPGPIGFELAGRRFRLDPGYMPGFMLNYLHGLDPEGPWDDVWRSQMDLASQIFRAGVAPDLYVVDSHGRVGPDTEREPSGSYDAIRVYLWAGMAGPDQHELLDLLDGFAKLMHADSMPPEKVDPRTGRVTSSGFSPLGFSGAVLPYLSALGEERLLDRQLRRLRTAAARARRGEATHYYDQVLILFGKGWLDGQYRIDERGRVQPGWNR